MSKTRVVPQSEQNRVLSTAVLRAADLLQIRQAKLAGILGLSAASVSRMADGKYSLVPGRKEWELGILFVRLFRSLDSIVGGRETDARAWMHSHNTALVGVPADKLQSVQGLVQVTEYLDAVRGRI